MHEFGQSSGSKLLVLLVSDADFALAIAVAMLAALHQHASGQIVAIDGIPVLGLHQVFGSATAPITDHSATGPPSPAT